LAPRPGLEPGTYGLTVVNLLILRDCMDELGLLIFLVDQWVKRFLCLD